MATYIKVYVYKNSEFGDSTNNGVTSNDDLEFYVEVPRGHIKLEEIEANDNAVLLIPNPNSRNPNYTSFVNNARKDRWGMFGGNFVWSTDSRFREYYPAPVPVHDRFES